MARKIEDLVEAELKKEYLFVKYLVDDLTLEEAVKIVDFRKKITDNKPCYILADVHIVKKAKKEVKNYLANEGAVNVIGSALCFDTKSSKKIINFFIFLSHPKVKLKAFDTYEEADLWLKSLIHSTI